MLNTHPKANWSPREDTQARADALAIQDAAERLHLSHRLVQLSGDHCQEKDALVGVVDIRQTYQRW